VSTSHLPAQGWQSWKNTYACALLLVVSWPGTGGIRGTVQRVRIRNICSASNSTVMNSIATIEKQKRTNVDFDRVVCQPLKGLAQR
jgi:hypothetical protein